ncbi:50S ribosome-binding GTPase [Nocardioides lentus]|uniref:50S ribosome-binding GTPase n=1 Tax=Nocardioides lentus TaxID=338077 RepID=A0ABN2PFE5_9ACTN
MTSLPEGPHHRPGPSTGLAGRVDALTTAVERARGRVEESVVDDARATAERAAARMRLSAEHTVVAIAGATGSGKSSTFNALTGLDLSAVGVRRPTTSWATACVWGGDDATEVLDWLGIPPRHQTNRDSMLDATREDNDLDGVVLLDLPDHDSTEVSHHLEVDRLVDLADLMVWVLDPQKYADAAVHDRYLAPLAAHAETIVVVLNHLDAVPEPRRESMLDDVRRLLVDDGLGGVPVIGVSAREGWGVDELRTEVARRVRDKAVARGRLERDVRAAADRLAEASGTTGSGPAHHTLSGSRAGELEAALADAAGVGVVVEAVETAARRRAARATGWPLLAWTGALGKDPAARTGLDLQGAGGDDAVAAELAGGASTPSTARVQGSRVDAALRDVADDVSRGMSEAWQDAVRRASVSRSDEVVRRLDETLAATELEPTRLPGWVHAVRVVQWLLLLVALAGGAWYVATIVGATAEVTLAGVPVALALLVGGLVLGLVLALVCRALVGRAGRFRGMVADTRMRSGVHDVATELVVTPVRAELAAHAELSDALATARR